MTLCNLLVSPEAEGENAASDFVLTVNKIIGMGGKNVTKIYVSNGPTGFFKWTLYSDGFGSDDSRRLRRRTGRDIFDRQL